MDHQDAAACTATTAPRIRRCEADPWEREEVGVSRVDSGEVEPWGWEWVWEEVGVSGEPDGARRVDEMPPALPSGREEERGVGDEAGVGGEMVSDGRDEAGSLGVKRAFVEVFAGALFYPTVLNYGRSLIEPEFHWWDRIDKVSSRLYSSSFTGRILQRE